MIKALMEAVDNQFIAPPRVCLGRGHLMVFSVFWGHFTNTGHPLVLEARSQLPFLFDLRNRKGGDYLIDKIESNLKYEML